MKKELAYLEAIVKGKAEKRFDKIFAEALKHLSSNAILKELVCGDKSKTRLVNQFKMHGITGHEFGVELVKFTNFEVVKGQLISELAETEASILVKKLDNL